MMTLRAEDPQTACRHKAQQGCGHHSLVTPIDWKHKVVSCVVFQSLVTTRW